MRKEERKNVAKLIRLVLKLHDHYQHPIYLNPFEQAFIALDLTSVDDIAYKLNISKDSSAHLMRSVYKKLWHHYKRALNLKIECKGPYIKNSIGRIIVTDWKEPDDSKDKYFVEVMHGLRRK